MMEKGENDKISETNFFEEEYISQIAYGSKMPEKFSS